MFTMVDPHKTSLRTSLSSSEARMGVIAVVTIVTALVFIITKLELSRRRDPLKRLHIPPRSANLLGTHLPDLSNSSISHKIQHDWIQKYGRMIRIRGITPWGDRLLPLDPKAVEHILKRSDIYEKPKESKSLIRSMIGEGMFAAEGLLHQKQRRIMSPAFSGANMRALVSIVWSKSQLLKSLWVEKSEQHSQMPVRVDLMAWMIKFASDVMGEAGFGCEFGALTSQTNELLRAYQSMFRVGLAEEHNWWLFCTVYAPWLNTLIPSYAARVVRKSNEVIQRVVAELIHERKFLSGSTDFMEDHSRGKDLLTLLIKSNLAEEASSGDRLSDLELLENMNSMIFAASDNTACTLTWTLLMLARKPEIQGRLRRDLQSIWHQSHNDLTTDEVMALYANIASLSYLDKVLWESLRFIPAVPSSLRVATRDDVIPTSYPIHVNDGGHSPDESRRHVRVRAGTYVHVPIEALHLDKGIWGDDAWTFRPDRWDNLPETVQQLPGGYNHLLSFSHGPRSCIGQRFALIEMKITIATLVMNFVFTEADEKVFKDNVVLNRPYVVGKFEQGAQCPIHITPYREVP